ncbi:MAG: thiamine pyrophosphate-dependent enzyme, partial [Thermoanaerobaculia bacterium]
MHEVDPEILDSFRRWGYLQADLDWLGRLEPAPHNELAWDHPDVERIRQWYCGTLAVEFMHIPDPDRRAWIQSQVESEHETSDTWHVLRGLMRASLLEEVLQKRYIGTKRFSVEGHEALIPFLEETFEQAAARKAEAVVLAMSHRGRLNVMVNSLGVHPRDLFAGFEDVDPRSVMGAGDVRYHLGATGTFESGSGHKVDLHLVSNPSHLEAVAPVAVGRAKAKQIRVGDTRGHKVLPLILHGDAAMAGQGITAETFNLASLEGFSVGGSLHVVVNNLIGFTTNPRALYSSRFSSDIAKRMPIPVFHANAEDPDAVIHAARLAVGYRNAFGSDVVVDLIGFRRHGHSEIDDPTLTQPELYSKIKKRPPLWRRFAENKGIDEAEAEMVAKQIREELTAAQEAADGVTEIPRLATAMPFWSSFDGGPYRRELEVDTGLPTEEMQELATRLTTVPETFHLHPTLARLLEQRAAMGRGERPLDFGMAES